MRTALALALALSVSATGAAWAQNPTAAAAAAAKCDKPNALGVVRTVEIDTERGPGYGFEHFKA